MPQTQSRSPSDASKLPTRNELHIVRKLWHMTVLYSILQSHLEGWCSSHTVLGNRWLHATADDNSPILDV